jgi:hypothetical protein
MDRFGSDKSQDFLPADILGVTRAIKGFDGADFCKVFQTGDSQADLRLELDITQN